MLVRFNVVIIRTSYNYAQKSVIVALAKPHCIVEALADLQVLYVTFVMSSERSWFKAVAIDMAAQGSHIWYLNFYSTLTALSIQAYM